MNSAVPKILLIDDEPDIIQIVSYFLTKKGFEVSCANDGIEALAKLSENTYDVVICDFMMPRMDGITLLKTIRSRKDYTSFVFFSGNAQDEHEIKMIGLGAYALVPKTDFDYLPDIILKTLKHNEEVQKIDELHREDTDEFLAILHSTK